MPRLIPVIALLLGACTTSPALELIEAFGDPCPESGEHYHPD